MNVTYYFKNLEATDALKSYAQEKLEKVKSRLHHIEGIDVRFALERQNQIFEVTIHADARVFHLKKIDKDLYAAIDNAIAALNKQIDRYHKKIDEKSAPLPEDVIPKVESVEINPEEIMVYDAPAKPMDDVEAILQLKANRYRFFMYHKSTQERYSAAVVRPDGKYSIISPLGEPGNYQETVVRLKGNDLEKVSISLYPMAQLSVAEAVDKLLENHLEFLIFVNEDSKKMNILFRDKRGSLIIQRPAQ
ncbi:MAG: ribosome-associated translation inhibitor RaiA [Leptospiraceae bacterium]|nr:ribosome-associated translation inhibitor RaiA [Leptospiraceae bacterium]MDW8305540.1 ribosome-associated translation inhibitor RaiA [Leptospiraceae bacterium]